MKCVVVALILFLGITAIIPAPVEESEEEIKTIDYVIEKSDIVDVAKLALVENQFSKKLETSTAKKFPLTQVDMPWTKNELVAQIDGKVGIGVNEEEISFEKQYDSAGNLEAIVVYVPKSEILYQDIQEKVLKQYNGLFNNNPVSVSHYEKEKEALVQEQMDKITEEEVFLRTDKRVQELIEKRLKECTSEDMQVIFKEKE